MLEKMSDFFEKRLDGYDEHMKANIESASEFYPFTARCLPVEQNCCILDLGCGTGLELEEYYLLNPSAKVTGIDLSQGMLSVLKMKFADKGIMLIHGSYFDVPLGESVFDSTGLWITQRSIRTAGWCSLSATAWKSAQRFKAGSGRGIGFLTDAFGIFCVYGNRILLCMEICTELRYNFDVDSV